MSPEKVKTALLDTIIDVFVHMNDDYGCLPETE